MRRSSCIALPFASRRGGSCGPDLRVLHVWSADTCSAVPCPPCRSRLSASRPVAHATIVSCPGWSSGPSRSLPLTILARRPVGDREHSWGMSPIPYRGLRGDGIPGLPNHPRSRKNSDLGLFSGWVGKAGQVDVLYSAKQGRFLCNGG